MKTQNKTNTIISLIINASVLIFTIFSCIVLFSGYQFMPETPLIETTKLGMFQFFTTDSNIFMGIVALIFVVEQSLVLAGKRKQSSKNLLILKFVSTAAVTLTLLVVFCYLSIVVNGKIGLLLKNSSLFFHLINPVLSIIAFVLFERTDKIKFKHTIWGIAPVCAYGVFYISNTLIHAQGGRVSTDFDFYHLFQGGVWQMTYVVPLLVAIAFGISVSLWASNKVRKNDK